MKALTAFLMMCAAAAHAQQYPSKPVRIIVPYPAGGGTDLVARFIGQKLGDAFGRPVVIENRAGANGLIGTEAMAKAPADGYTVGMATPGPVTVAKSLYPNLGYDPERDLAPVILANASPNVLAIHPSVPARNVKELVALAKQRPIHLGASTIGSVQHLLAEMLKRETGAKMDVITYKGGAQVATDTVGGQIEALWSVLPVVLPFMQNGRLRVLAVANEKRSTLIPNVPTMGEAGWPAVLATAWNGVVAPAATPKMVIAILNKEIARSLEAGDVKERFTAAGMEAIGGTPEEFAAFLRAESAKWAKVVKAANVKPE